MTPPFRCLTHLVFFLCAASVSVAPARAVPPLSERIATVQDRLVAAEGREAFAALKITEIAARLTPAERQDLGENFLHFTLAAAAEVRVVLPASKDQDPFWLPERGFERTGERWVVGAETYEAWRRVFPAGRVALGIPSLGGTREAYFVVLSPGAGSTEPPGVTEMFPASRPTGVVELGARPYVDKSTKLTAFPRELTGHRLIQVVAADKSVARLHGLYRLTKFPSSPQPDQIVLTWSEDPRTTQTIRWRTAGTVTRGEVRFAEKGAAFDPEDSAVGQRVTATPRALHHADVANDPAITLHTAVVTGLTPATTYVYAVGDGTPGAWSAPAEFTTAPAAPVSFSFLYFGDAQNGFASWGQLAREALATQPQAAFVAIAGDLVSRGQERDDWDDFLAHAAGIFDRRSVLPAIGNHEAQGGAPTLYRQQFTLPANGPSHLPRGDAYTVRYGPALLVVLDSNEGVAAQTPWLEAQLRDTDATWKIVMYHHPMYASRPGRFYADIRQWWAPVFDRYHVDLALQGHDHAYLRTYPMKAHTRAASPTEGTTYLITVSGTKMYEQAPHAYTEAGFTGTATYQILDFDMAQKRLRYRAYALGGVLKDEFVLQK